MKKRILSIILVVCTLLSISFVNVCAESEYITKSYMLDLPLGKYNVSVSRFHNGYCGKENGEQWHFNVYISLNGIEIQNHHVFLDKKSGCWKDYESKKDITYGKDKCYTDSDGLLKSVLEKTGHTSLANKIYNYSWLDSLRGEPRREPGLIALVTSRKEDLNTMFSIYSAITSRGAIGKFLSLIGNLVPAF
ncbi:MAG: hypothetical protein BWY74_01324 [Firmicutes bacterium ADurb.Bin419]|nr:MAG: hypothetical protein BWY74_01324 [Firmicutes bacterium ADurb.Bin419]